MGPWAGHSGGSTLGSQRRLREGGRLQPGCRPSTRLHPPSLPSTLWASLPAPLHQGSGAQGGTRSRPPRAHRRGSGGGPGAARNQGGRPARSVGGCADRHPDNAAAVGRAARKLERRSMGNSQETGGQDDTRPGRRTPQKRAHSDRGALHPTQPAQGQTGATASTGSESRGVAADDPTEVEPRPRASPWRPATDTQRSYRRGSASSTAAACGERVKQRQPSAPERPRSRAEHRGETGPVRGALPTSRRGPWPCAPPALRAQPRCRRGHWLKNQTQPSNKAT